jgi:hypothetical protein
MGMPFEVVMTKCPFGSGFERNGAGGLDLAYSGRRTKVIANAIGATEAGGGDDFFVVDSLVTVAGFVLVGDVPLARERTESTVKWHGTPPPRWGLVDEGACFVHVPPAAEPSQTT